ncbi:MAG: ATP/GTP-binding protein [Promethearchaeota archaeon]
MQRVKIVVTGPEATGKSTFIQNFAENQALSTNYKGKTVALDFCRRSVSGIDIFAFGTPGLEQYEFMRKILVQGAQGILVLFDSTNPESFKAALEMVPRLLDYLTKKVPVVLVANKQDLPDALDVSYFSLIAGDSLPVIGASAKTGDGVEQAIDMLLNMTLKYATAV